MKQLPVGSRIIRGNCFPNSAGGSGKGPALALSSRDAWPYTDAPKHLETTNQNVCFAVIRRSIRPSWSKLFPALWYMRKNMLLWPSARSYTTG